MTDIELPALLRRGGEPAGISLETAALVLHSLAGQTVTLDCETSGYPQGHPLYRLRTVQVGNEHFALDLDAADGAQLQLAVAAVDSASEIVAHSATADVSLLAIAAGVDPEPWWDKTTDTIVLTALAPESVVGGFLGLEKLTERLIEDPYKPTTAAARRQLFSSNGWLTETKPDTAPERSGWANVPIGHPVMVRYAAADVLDTARLRKALPEPSTEVLERERKLHGILARVTERGLRLDPQRVSELIDTHTDAARAAAGLLNGRWGLDRPSSNKAVADVLAGMGADLPATASGAPSVAKDALDELVRSGGQGADLAETLLEFRHHDKLVGTYLSALEYQCAGDGRVYPVVHQLGARATGRMSSTGPNIQNWPRPSKNDTTGGLRGMIVSDPGTRFISADFSSVEVRLAAAVTGDETLARMVREGLDLHGKVVELVWGYTQDDPRFADARYAAKRAVFGYLYGAGLRRLSMQLGEHGDKAGDVVAALQEITPQLYQWNTLIRQCVRGGQVQSWTHPSGRVAYFDPALPHKALNTVVQGWGRELLVDSILRWEQKHPGCMLWPIHDELVIQVPAEHAEAWTADLVECMTTTVGSGESTVPIVCESDPPTTRWGAADTVEV